MFAFELFEDIILRWVCLFDEFRDVKQSNINNLLSSRSFKKYVDSVFCIKCSLSFMSDNEKLYKTIKVNYQEFEVQKFEDMYNNENAVYTCIIVFLHALLKCTNNKYRYQLSEKMDNKQQVLLVTFLETIQTSLFSKQNIFEALLVLNDKKLSSPCVSETFSDTVAPIMSKSVCESYLQDVFVLPKPHFLVCQENEKLILKLTEDIKNECEENERLDDNVKLLQDINLKLSIKLDEKEKIIKLLKDEIEELFQPKDFSDIKVNHSLAINKLNQNMIDLEINNNELIQQIEELRNQNKDLSLKFEKKTSSYENLLLTCDSIESENMLLKQNIHAIKKSLKKKDTEIIFLKDELYNRSVSNNLMNISCQETNFDPQNTLFDELYCLKLEELISDKEIYKQKCKTLKINFLNTENYVKDLEEQILTLKQQLQSCEINNDINMNIFPEKKIELIKRQKKNNQRHNLIEESINIKSTQTDKSCNHVATYKEKFLEYEEQNFKIISEKIASKVNINKQNKNLEITYQDLTQLSEMKKQLYDDQKKLNSMNLELQKKVNEEQTVISILISKKKELINFTGVLKDCLSEKGNIIFESKPNETKVKLYNTQHGLICKINTLHNVPSEFIQLINTFMANKIILVDGIRLEEILAQNQKKSQPAGKQNNNKQNIEYMYTTLMVELYQIKCLMDNLCPELSKNEKMKTLQLYKAQDKLGHIQSDIKKPIELKNDSLADVYKQINDLETFVSTFIEKTNIQLAQVEIFDYISITGKLKRIFKALQMLIINNNTQSNENGSNNAYIELFSTYNKQLETIKNLKNEMTRLKFECRYKMSKVQQKTQEIVTLEYKKKFEQKRQQMKQFYKDLEIKIQQDYEAKLKSYKKKANMDEINIKQLGQQLWDINEKYLKLQQQSRQESIIMSLPCEISTCTISTATTNKISRNNSNALSKYCLPSQIKTSIIEENIQFSKNCSEQNVQSGIGKKLRLLSSKIFPREADKKCEPFTHLCPDSVKLDDNNGKQYNKNLSGLQAHDSRVPIHLRNDYDVGTNIFSNNLLITTEDMNVDHNDSKCENLIPKDSYKNKYRQISYKKPGPPTPFQKPW